MYQPLTYFPITNYFTDERNGKRENVRQLREFIKSPARATIEIG